MKPEADPPIAGPAPGASGGPLWGRSLAWLALLGPLFFLSYGWANQFAASRGVTDSVVFGWERQIPFVPWTIFPYWSIDLLYGLSFLCCRSRAEVDRHAFRLLTAQFVSIAFFVLLPLRFSFERPPAEGLAGQLFAALAGFDQPYNQAPSLHISLLVIIWYRFVRSLPPRWCPLAHLWAVLIGASVLTTYQHHFVDIPSGALAGFLCLWLWPEGRSPLVRGETPMSPRRLRLAGYYLAGSGLCVLLSLAGGLALLAWWPALALALVAHGYLWAGEGGFQKRGGRQSLAVQVLAAPYRLGAWINSRLWTRHRPNPDEIADGVWLGRMPSAAEWRAGGFDGLCDLTAELQPPRAVGRYRGIPMLDLVIPGEAALREATEAIEALRRPGGRVLVCCALGYGRSALALSAWLYLSGRARSPEDAAALVRSRRPRVVIEPGALSGLRPAAGHGDG